LHREPGRRRVARAPPVAPVRQPLHALRAHRAAVDVQPRDPLPPSGAAVAGSRSPVRGDLMKFTRRQVLAGAAASAVGATGIYELVDQLTSGSPKRPANTVALPEQHLLDGVRIVESNHIEVLVPPLHHEIHTAKLAVDRADLSDAQSELARTLDGLDRDYVPSPAGLGVTAAVLPAARPRRRAPVPPARPAREQAGDLRCAAVPERSGGHAPRGERR